MAGNSIVFVVDDDRGLRTSICSLLKAVELDVEAFASAEDFLARIAGDFPGLGCIILDLLMPGISGLELLERLRDSPIDIPIIVLTAVSEPAIAVKAMKLGAFDFVEKPLHPQLIIERVEQALQEHSRRRAAKSGSSQTRIRLARLSVRERDVYELLLQGKRSKEIAATLGIGVPTVTKHRSRVFQKMGVDNAVDLVRQATGSLLSPEGGNKA